MIASFMEEEMFSGDRVSLVASGFKGALKCHNEIDPEGLKPWWARLLLDAYLPKQMFSFFKFIPIMSFFSIVTLFMSFVSKTALFS